MATAPPGDPRAAPEGQGVKPVVALPRTGPSWIVIAIGMAILGVLLFSVLDARRQSLNAPAVRTGAGDQPGSGAAGTAAPPPLYLPPAPPTPQPQTPVEVQPAPAPVAAPPPPPQIVYMPQPAPPPQIQLPPAPPPRSSGDPALVIDTTTAEAPSGPATPAAAGDNSDSNAQASPVSVAGGRARAGLLANRSTTVPQGTLIPAVLETGLDSTRPGLARAMVTKDVRGFDGKRVLIPRGSRLIGEYATQAQPGQKRALVNWIRLIRPDGATIAIGSPASDPLGRGGVKAKVDNHFFQRFAGAILQSALDVGVNLATRYSSSSPVIVALPGTLQSSTQSLTQPTQQITPTLKVDPGTSITIFVARDLDFTSADSRP